MSGLPEISLDEEIQFLKSVVIPSFAPRLKFGSDEEKRSEWMKLKAEKYLTKEKADELMDRFGIVSTLDEAKAEKKELEGKQERQQQLSAETDPELKSMIEDSHRILTALFSLQGEAVLLDAVSTDSEREVHHLDFEANVSISYGCIDLIAHPNMLRCVVTGQFHPQKMVCKGAHLLAIKERHAMHLVGLKKCDIWDARNGLCVLRTIDKRFESKELVYMPISGVPDAYRIEVLYDDVLPIVLGITVGELNGNTDATPATFAHINGRQLSFTTPFRPFRRILLLIAFSAFTLALDNTRRTHTLATTAAPRDVAAWRSLFDAASVAGSPPLPADGFIMQRFLKV